MSISRDPRERQKDELQALQSIFPGDVEDKRTKDWQSLELEITIRSQKSSSPDAQAAPVQIRLWVKCPNDYPYVQPEIRVKDVSGIPHRAIGFLENELHRLIQENAGSEVIFILVNHIQEFLVPFDNCDQSSPIRRQVSPGAGTKVSDFDGSVVPTIPDAQRISYSRFADEFELVEKLGTGGFGDVYKAKNKLDGQEYAIKKVPINLPEKQHHKIFREVKLLSRLVHENIVRYYSNWIETEGIVNESSDSTTSDQIVRVTVEDPDDSIFRDSSLALPKHSVSSDYIQYERSSGADDDDGEPTGPESKSSTKDASKGTNTSTSTAEVMKRFMFIQMELCEEKTLRDWIDDRSLISNPELRTRLFRDIVEGLTYLHSCSVVHRDLKPGNIFFVKGRAKIGDLGLAISAGKGEQLNSEKVGTFHYFAPELDHVDSSDRIKDSSKLDIFSLGITAFEMFYKPVKTGMERHQILTNLRKSPSEFPQDFVSCAGSAEYEELISRMIIRDPDQRPSAAELLESPLIPPNDLGDDDKNWIIKQLTSSRAHKDFQTVLDNLFANSMPPKVVQFDGYDRFCDERRLDTLTRKTVHPRDRRRVAEVVKCLLVQVMKRFGAVHLSIPTFNLKSCASDIEKFLLIDQRGNLMYPTYSLRESFIRFCVKHHLTSVRRYAIEKVFRKSDHIPYSALEITEVAYDAIFPIDCPPTLPESILLMLISEIISILPGLSSRQLCLNVSHNGIFPAVLRYCDIKTPEMQKEVIALLSNHSDDFTLFEKEMNARNLLTDNTKTKLMYTTFTLSRESFSDFRDTMKQMIRRKQTPEQKQHAEEVVSALSELKIIDKALGVICASISLKFCGFLLESSDVYTGLVVQVELIKSGLETPKLLGVGGRYDLLWLNDASLVSQRLAGGVGVSFEFERLVSLTMQEETRKSIPSSFCDVLLAYSLLNSDPQSSQQLMLECLHLAKWIRAAGLSVVELTDDVHTDQVRDRVISFSRENLIRSAVLLSSDADERQKYVCRVFSFEKDRPVEKKVQNYSHREVTDILKQFIKSDHATRCETSPTYKPESKNSSFSNYDSSVSMTEKSNANFKIDLQFVRTENSKLASNQRKRYEALLSNLLNNAFGSCSNLSVLALDLPIRQLKMISSDIDLDDDASELRKSLDSACISLSDKLPRLKKYLPEILDEIFNLKTNKKSPVITLYSCTDNKFVTFS